MAHNWEEPSKRTESFVNDDRRVYDQTERQDPKATLADYRWRLGGGMKIRHLPRELLEALLAMCANAELRCKDIPDIDIEELEPYIRAAVEDRDAPIDRVRKWCALMYELGGLLDPVDAPYPHLGIEEQIGRLYGSDRVRAHVIYRELLEMAVVL
jgi:hypothetical protein